VGELDTIAASVGIVLHALAHDPDLQARLRAEPKREAAAIDEALRVRGPLIANRRVATRDVELAGQPVRAGDRVRVLWPSANRDERVFEAPEEIRLDRSPHDDLFFGAGVHVCPGAPSARLELRVLVEELLARTRAVPLRLSGSAGPADQVEDPPASAFPCLTRSCAARTHRARSRSLRNGDGSNPAERRARRDASRATASNATSTARAGASPARRATS